MSNSRIVILGGYGTFGSLIAEQLAQSGTQLVIAGRDAVKGEAFAASVGAGFVRCDARNQGSLSETIAGAYLLINAAGPFQARDYTIPETCIEQRCHYIDLGDGREYVAGVAQLHASAKARDVFVCLGASTPIRLSHQTPPFDSGRQDAFVRLPPIIIDGPADAPQVSWYHRLGPRLLHFSALRLPTVGGPPSPKWPQISFCDGRLPGNTGFAALTAALPKLR